MRESGWQFGILVVLVLYISQGVERASSPVRVRVLLIALPRQPVVVGFRVGFEVFLVVVELGVLLLAGEVRVACLLRGGVLAQVLRLLRVVRSVAVEIVRGYRVVFADLCTALLLLVRGLTLQIANPVAFGEVFVRGGFDGFVLLDRVLNADVLVLLNGGVRSERVETFGYFGEGFRFDGRFQIRLELGLLAGLAPVVVAVALFLSFCNRTGGFRQ